MVAILVNCRFLVRQGGQGVQRLRCGGWKEGMSRLGEHLEAWPREKQQKKQAMHLPLVLAQAGQYPWSIITK